MKFAVTDLSNFYLDTAKDRLYIQGTDSFERRSCQTVMRHLLEGLAVMIAPLTPHMAEDVWQAVPYDVGSARSIFQAGWKASPAPWTSIPAEDREAVSAMLAVRDLANKVLERIPLRYT